MSDYILRIKGISKSFSGVKALDNIHFDLIKGEVHALMGENGAGKSTFMKILIGLVAPDSGEVLLEGENLIGNNVNETLKKGISMIHQEILIIPELTVAQNIFLGREREVSGKKGLLSGWLNDSEINQRAGALLDRMGVDIAPKTKMKHLSVAQMQMVEIAKAVSNDAKVIIMDEPTSAISDKEVGTLFQIIRDLKAQGVSIIYISHKMDEIFQISDTISVLRDGKYIGTKSAADLDQNALIAMMVGREIDQMFPEATQPAGGEVLSVQNLGRAGKFSNISFEVKSGEILGLAGLMGAGRTEIARAIFGLDQWDEGEISIKQSPFCARTPREAIDRGIGYVSEDRKGLGFIPRMSVKSNITLSSMKNHRKGGFINTHSEQSVTEKMIADLKIKTAGADQHVTYLSGGNQQKVVIGKVLLASPEIIILDEPTRGVDVGAKFEIYKLIRSLADRGMAIIMISSELPEILGLSDRILVLSKGKQTALLSRAEATQELIMRYAVA
ncbi:putative ribose/galactose/methyl galactoside import ATP-binding protein 2 [Dyadobacter endophyticus]|uniref:Ribose/galactose/methyl galactoside import ATP-binding protein 2 n=1 Tax=Dyadobacter endophyticus TaxID=1749036 RepID=A0ABQ1Z2D9_9BACT|nr:sugar ABC transporter ATP-binding protein [Dyadobacter endophyticus]GGH47657.1 putative ribose/galactose/methyl galactoside import ATP-binding protein 2 [Dyadobacter endophyticus]